MGSADTGSTGSHVAKQEGSAASPGSSRMIWATLSSLALPALFARTMWNQEWRNSIEERCISGGWRDLPKRSSPPIWFHGASLGELTGIVPVLDALRQVHSGIPIHLTTTSMTGRHEARERRLADRVCLLPLDHPVFVRRAVKALAPRLFVVAETELWPNLYAALDDAGIPRVLFNGRISRYSFPNYRRFRGLFRPLVANFAAILAQTQKDAERFEALGAPHDRIQVVGSTKYSRAPERLQGGQAEVRQRFGIGPDGIWFVAGSVRPGEEEEVIAAYLLARKTLPLLRLLIAPRHSERFDPVAEMLRAAGIQFARRSRGAAGPAVQAILLDTVGELGMAYGLATVAFVGGTLVDIGGHNPMEPASLGVPVLVGPYVDNIADAVEELGEGGGLFVVDSRDELARKVLEIAGSPEIRARMGKGAYDVWERNSHAVERVLPVLEHFCNMA